MGCADGGLALLQIRRMLGRHSSADVSIAYLAVLEFGFLLWVGYGISLGNPVIAVPNSVAAMVGAATILVAWSLRRGPAPPEASAGASRATPGSARGCRIGRGLGLGRGVGCRRR